LLLSRIVDEVFRNEGRRMLAGLIRLTGDFDAAEDALQEACVRALEVWGRDGLPERPAAWLNTVSRRIAIDRFRRDRTRDLPEDLESPVTDTEPDPAHAIEDDRLRLLFVCCHPALATDARCALALRTLGGLTTREIARAFVEPEATTAQRLVRAKKKIREAGIPFEVPPSGKLAERTADVLSVLYLIFNEGYASTDAPSLLRPDLVREAIRLARLAAELLPREAEARGLLALMLLTDARRAARTDTDGRIVPLAEQHRHLWDAAAITEGQAILTRTLGAGPAGPYQLQAAIAALHDEAPTAQDTDWPQILALYDVLTTMAPGPVVTLSRAVALAMVHGPRAGLALLGTLDTDDRMAHTHRLEAVRAHLLEQAGDTTTARQSYLRAARMTASLPEQRYLELRAAQLRHPAPPVDPGR
jgi:RNA polymerase sigma factor (sigma-70 family)